MNTTGKTLYKNLKGWDFDLHGSFKLDKQDCKSALKAFKMLADKEERNRLDAMARSIAEEDYRQ